MVTKADVDSIKARLKTQYEMSNKPSRTPKSACKAASKPPTTSSNKKKSTEGNDGRSQHDITSYNKEAVRGQNCHSTRTNLARAEVN